MRTISIYADTEVEINTIVLGITLILTNLGYTITMNLITEIEYEPIKGWKAIIGYKVE